MLIDRGTFLPAHMRPVCFMRQNLGRLPPGRLWSNSLSMTFRSNGIRQLKQLSQLLHNVYTDDVNHHIQATGLGCCVGGARVNSHSYADDMVLCTHANWSSDTLRGMSRICWTSRHCIQHNENSTHAGPTEVSQGRYSTRLRLGNEELRFVDKFCYLVHVMTADCRDDKDI